MSAIGRFRGAPEPPLEPYFPYYITADCGCDIEDGRTVYEWHGRTYCRDCLEDVLRDALDTDFDGFAREMGVYDEEVRRPRHGV